MAAAPGSPGGGTKIGFGVIKIEGHRTGIMERGAVLQSERVPKEPKR